MGSAIGRIWKLHGDGRSVRPGEVVRPDERLHTSNMLGLGAQHVLAMFGATALVPVLTGFPVTTTVFFSGIGTILFNLITRNRVPSYTGSSFAFIAPVIAAKAHGGMPAALGGILCAGLVLIVVGLIVDRVGYGAIEFLLPPVVTGAIVALIGLNLAPVAKDQFTQQAGIAIVTLVSILLIGVALKGFVSRLSVFAGVVVGYVFAAILGKVDWDGVHKADWIGFPDITTPHFSGKAIVLIVPAVILVLLAENAGHVKAVATMTEHDLDPLIGRSFVADGVATTVSGPVRRLGHDHVRGEHRRHGLHARVLDARLPDRRHDRDPARPAAEVRRDHQRDPDRRARRRRHRAVRHDRGARRAHLGRRARRLPRPREPRDGGRRADRRAPATTRSHWGDYQFAGIALGSLAAIVIYQVLRAFSPEVEPRGAGQGGAFGDPLAEPLSRTPDPRATWPATPVLRRERAFLAPAAERAHEVTRPLDLDAAAFIPWPSEDCPSAQRASQSGIGD